MNIVHDPGKHFLGKLCKYNHDWENSGFSLRLINSKHCAICRKEYYQNYRQENSDKLKEYHQNYRQENGDKLKEYHQNYSKGNTDRLKEYQQNYRQENCDKLRESKRSYYQKNPDRSREQHQNYYKNNLDKVREYQRNYQQENADRIREHQRNYQQENADTIREQKRNYRQTSAGKNSLIRGSQKRRALKNKCHSLSYKPEDILNLFNSECAYCSSKENLTLDHFIPLSKGGSNVQGNLLPACKSCNSSKNNRDAIEWYKKQPFFNQKRWRQILKTLGKTESNCDQIPLF